MLCAAAWLNPAIKTIATAIPIASRDSEAACAKAHPCKPKTPPRVLPRFGRKADRVKAGLGYVRRRRFGGDDLRNARGNRLTVQSEKRALLVL